MTTFGSIREGTRAARVLGLATERLMDLCELDEDLSAMDERANISLTDVELVVDPPDARDQAAVLLIRNVCERALVFEAFADEEQVPDESKKAFVRRASSVCLLLHRLVAGRDRVSAELSALASLLAVQPTSLLSLADRIDALVHLSPECKDIVSAVKERRENIIELIPRETRASVLPSWSTPEGELRRATAASDTFSATLALDGIDCTLELELRRLEAGRGAGKLKIGWRSSALPPGGIQLEIEDMTTGTVTFKRLLTRRRGRMDLVTDEIGFDPASRAIRLWLTRGGEGDE